ncbi:MAG: amidohydrolase family protein [Candidatus Zipacnadales bacterium]
MPQLVFFDCNTRIGRSSVRRPEHFHEVRELLAEMDYGGIEYALVYHAWSVEWDPAEGNQALLQEIRGEKRLRPCFTALPPATQELLEPRHFAKRVRELHGAVRLFPIQHQFLLTEVSCGRLLDALSFECVPLLLDIGQTNWRELAEILQRHPALNLILLNAYYRIDRYLYPLLERFPNLYLEIGSYGVHRGIETVCQRFGAERLVFGTDLPIHEVGGPIALVTYAPITAEAKQAIAAGNLQRLLGESE